MSEESLKVGPVALMPGVRKFNFWTFMYAAFICIAMLAGMLMQRPISPTILNKIREQFQIEMTYNSNAIEGNSLTLKETFWVINEGLTIKEKPLKDHLEAKNHKEALDFLYELIDHRKRNTISEHLIKGY